MDEVMTERELEVIEEWSELRNQIRAIRAQLRRVTDEVEQLEQLIDDDYRARIDQIPQDWP